jgi:UDP-N-acetylmuramate--alanine ligase
VSTETDPHASAADADVEVDLSAPRRIHIVGVGGAAMSAIATVLVTMGHRVSGSDLAESVALDRLRSRGVAVAVGHDAANVPGDADLVAVSTAIPGTNPELVAARDRGIPVASRSQLMVAIAAHRHTVAVAGTHGKTTTASMLAVILADAGRDPSFVIGGELRRFGGGAAWSDGDLFVAEADESDGMFLDLPRHAAIVTNVEPDHLDHYGGEVARLQAAFAAFVDGTEGPKVVGADDPVAVAIGRAAGARTVGTAPDADDRVVVQDRPGPGIDFAVVRDGATLAEVQLPMAGRYNARNAAAALTMAVELGVAPAVAAASLSGFTGVARRFEARGETGGVTFVDDYAHLPTEVADAVGAAVEGGWRRVVCAFQPHRYSRTAVRWADFADAFEGVDLLAITDVYAAGESPRPGVSGLLIVRAVLDRHPWHHVAYLPTLDDVAHYLAGVVRPGDLCLTLGAGDLTTVPDAVQARLGSG